MSGFGLNAFWGTYYHCFTFLLSKNHVFGDHVNHVLERLWKLECLNFITDNYSYLSKDICRRQQHANNKIKFH